MYPIGGKPKLFRSIPVEYFAKTGRFPADFLDKRALIE
jgi:hypothetical protein